MWCYGQTKVEKIGHCGFAAAVVNAWNDLPHSVVDPPYLPVFKTGMLTRPEVSRPRLRPQTHQGQGQ